MSKDATCGRDGERQCDNYNLNWHRRCNNKLLSTRICATLGRNCHRPTKGGGQKLWCIKLAICPDQPSRYSPLKFCMRGRVWETVIYFKFHENTLRGLGAAGVENRHLQLTRPMARTATTACTTIQAALYRLLSLSIIIRQPGSVWVDHVVASTVV